MAMGLSIELRCVIWTLSPGITISVSARQVARTGHVRGPEVELRPVVVEERRVTPTLLLAEDVDLGLELGVRGDRAGLAEHLAALDVFLLDAAQQDADVVARLAWSSSLAEHLHPGAGRS